MDLEIKGCNNCEKRTDDHYAEIGWINFETSQNFQITISKGRRKEGQAKSDYKSFPSELDFCSLDCFNEFVTRGLKCRPKK